MRRRPRAGARSYQTLAGAPVLIGLVAGEAAQSFESLTREEATARCVAVLRGIFGRKGVHVPEPLASVCTRWASDPFAQGSYSHVAARTASRTTPPSRTHILSHPVAAPPSPLPHRWARAARTTTR